MVLLHYRLTEKNQSIEIPSTIHAQSFIFRRAVVRMNPLTAGSSSTILKGGVIFSPSHFSGFEISSGTSISSTTNKPITNNLGFNDILLGLDEYKPINNIYFDMEFASEDINRGFTVSTRNFDREDVAVFGTGPGQVKSIDIYFQFSSLYKYEGY